MKPILFLLFATSAFSAVHEADVCVFGGTSGGVSAAVQVARMGKTVVLAEPGRHLGGMTSGGLSAVDTGTETRILAHLRGARAGRTAIIVSHRLSAVATRRVIEWLLLLSGLSLVAKAGVWA